MVFGFQRCSKNACTPGHFLRNGLLSLLISDIMNYLWTELQAPVCTLIKRLTLAMFWLDMDLIVSVLLFTLQKFSAARKFLEKLLEGSKEQVFLHPFKRASGRMGERDTI